MIIAFITGFIIIVVLDSVFLTLQKKKHKKLPWIYWITVLLCLRVFILNVEDHFERAWKALLLGACLRTHKTKLDVIDTSAGAILALVMTYISLALNKCITSDVSFIYLYDLLGRLVFK